jgi:hypothetical protein
VRECELVMVSREIDIEREENCLAGRGELVSSTTHTLLGKMQHPARPKCEIYMRNAEIRGDAHQLKQQQNRGLMRPGSRIILMAFR